MSIFKEIEQMLKDRGYKSTFSRKEIIKIFLTDKKHLRPEDIFDRVQDLGISLPTVYRNLEMLRENNIISEISVNGDRLYELRIFSKKVVHTHFSCKECGKLHEYTDSDIMLNFIEKKNLLEARYGDQIDDLEVVYKGICKECGEKNG